MFDALVAAGGHLASVDVFLILMLGVATGLVFGVLPGLDGMIAVCVLLPLTYGWEPMSAMYLFAGVMGAVPFAGSISAILINAPGTALSAASCFDGYPMSRRGEGAKAIGMSAFASTMGAIFGLVVLIAVIPLFRAFVMQFGAPEFFWLVVFGLTSLAVAGGGSMLKGLAAGGVGVLISLVGYSYVFGILRFNLGSEYLWDGLPLVPLLIGILAISQLISYSVKKGIIAVERPPEVKQVASTLDGIKEVFRNKRCFFQSSGIGTLIGMIPGVGGAVSNFLAYTTAMQTSRHPEKFGTGVPEGLIAPESANNATISGALLPTVAFGIPGSGLMAVLLGAFMLHGLAPGPTLIIEHLDIVLSLILGILVGNIIAGGVGLMLARFLARITTVNVSVLVPILLVFCLTGSFAIRGNLWDVLLSLFAGVFGYLMTRFGYSKLCFIIGYILGILAENSFHLSLKSAYGSYAIFFTRPISLALVIVIILMLISFLLMRKKLGTKAIGIKRGESEA